MKHNVLFLTLKVFSATGGIEKVCRVAGKSLYEGTVRHRSTAQVFCMHDRQQDADGNRYFPSEMFRGFGKRKVGFIWKALKIGRLSDTVILSHINLLLVGWLIKKCSPKTRIIMFAHGIEIWGKISSGKKMMLSCCDEIISVSRFTSDKIRDIHHIPEHKLKVLNNCLDPFLPTGYTQIPKNDLRAHYGFSEDQVILFTLTRLSSKERYKGYDKVLEAMVKLKQNYPGIRYLLAGSYDQEEKKHLDDMIDELGLAELVTIPGFIADEDLVSLFSLADLYVMPSIKEGFGIVFIEAMYYGLPVIAGNMDGSVDALRNGELGILVDPLDVDAISSAIDSIIKNKTSFVADRHVLLDNFGYEQYKDQFELIAGHSLSMKN